MSGRALVIGIDDYPDGRSLDSCVSDATQVCALLERHGNGDPNFDVTTLTSAQNDVSAPNILAHVQRLFKTPTDTAVFYFAGHGKVDDETQKGFLETSDGTKMNPGIDFSLILDLANKAFDNNIRSTVIILDCCQSGFAAEGKAYQGLSRQVSVIGDGLTILTASRSDQEAKENDEGHGTFTGLLLDGLLGAASDVLGRITPPSLYAHIDQSLGEWEQRPVYKANVQHFVAIRKIAPKVPLETLRLLPEFFPTPAHIFQLDPSFEKEEDRGRYEEEHKDIPCDPEKHIIFRKLQKLQGVGLVVPDDHPFMWDEAMNSGGCKLTATGAHYRYLAHNKKI